MYAKRLERKLKRWSGEEEQASMAVEFQDCGRPLETVMAFKYLRRFLTASDDNWPAVVENIWKASSRWAQLSSILGREG